MYYQFEVDITLVTPDLCNALRPPLLWALWINRTESSLHQDTDNLLVLIQMWPFLFLCKSVKTLQRKKCRNTGNHSGSVCMLARDYRLMAFAVWCPFLLHLTASKSSVKPIPRVFAVSERKRLKMYRVSQSGQTLFVHIFYLKMKITGIRGVQSYCENFGETTKTFLYSYE